MATAEAKHYHTLYGAPCVFRLGETLFYEPVIMKHNPKIVASPKSGQQVVIIENGPGKRPYIAGGDSKRWYWNTDFKAEPGEIYLKPDEVALGESAKGKIIIEPYVKETTYSQNKQWPHWGRFVQLAIDTEIGPHLVQLSYDKRQPLVPRIKCQDFRQALACVSNAAMLIVPDGGLHHAAAAMNVPCVTLWGGLIGPDLLGYDNQANIWHNTEACGSKHDCKHCRDAMNAITPEEVLETALAVWKAINEVR